MWMGLPFDEMIDCCEISVSVIDTFASDQCLIHVDPMVFAIWGGIDDRRQADPVCYVCYIIFVQTQTPADSDSDSYQFMTMGWSSWRNSIETLFEYLVLCEGSTTGH